MSTVNLTLSHFANRGAFKKGIISDLFCIVRFCAVTTVTAVITTNGAAYDSNSIKNEPVTAVTVLLNHLNIKPLLDMLNSLSPHAKVGIATPRKGEKSPLPLTVFLCPVIRNAGLIRVLFSMVDCLRKTLGLARSYTGTANLIQPTAQFFAEDGSGTPSLIGVTTMSRPKTAQPTPDPYGIIRASGEKPPRGFMQVCLCGFAKFSVAYRYCPQCGCSATSHSRYEVSANDKARQDKHPRIKNPRT